MSLHATPRVVACDACNDMRRTDRFCDVTADRVTSRTEHSDALVDVSKNVVGDDRPLRRNDDVSTPSKSVVRGRADVPDQSNTATTTKVLPSTITHQPCQHQSSDRQVHRYSRDYKYCDSTAIRLRSDYDVSRTDASIRRDSSFNASKKLTC